ncbi:hypothetical protein [Nocardia wallacei]|uniref:hypothetical protein n=1 Tax=Nocardia wallacei TaxID=480035 RepID=UPI0024539A1C|nr:hypothetical protein [Nocardia wallacei]
MGIAADLAAQPPAREPQYKPRIEYDGRTGFVDSDPHPVDETVAFDELLKKHGLAGQGVRLDPERPVRISRWQSFTGEWLQADRFYIVADRPGGVAAEQLIAQIIDRAPAPRPQAGGPAVFNFQASDLQIGKSDNGGTDQIVARYLEAVERAIEKYRQLRAARTVGTVHLMFPGDCVEGNQSQGGRNWWRTDLTVTEQIAVFEQLLYTTIDGFADSTDELLVDVVNGNHDEAQRFQITRPGDGWATHAASSVAKGLERNAAAYGHVQIRTPDPERGYMTVPAGDTVFTIAHGHQWRRGKAMEWWAGQAFHGQNPGAADVLVHGHYHTWELETTDKRARIQSSTLDGGSNYYREQHGVESRRGALIYLTRGGDIADLSLV